ncbi:hypothetical protein [Mesorhizobium sp. M7A.F.Ca.US.010.02.1.1]|uniref:hypothetical protein n=1 Tax=unclassified Mesorhizobium TaxID=325217 RepID=UPI001FE11F48|nr:hypothetical protein [Mesorhizobium sp. M7A.F.Ca.US.010.02.1.1]
MPAIKLVSMSTTLAMNALVQWQGGRGALVMIGLSRHYQVVRGSVPKICPLTPMVMWHEQPDQQPLELDA